MIPDVGATYLDGKPTVNLPDWRRIVEVTEVGSGYIHGVGRWQRLISGRWVDDYAPGNRRKTRILLATFKKQYTRIEVDA